jgi:hypothetical protein
MIFVACQQITRPLSVICHADGNVDGRAVEPGGERLGNVAAEADFAKVAIKAYGDPALAVSIEAERPDVGVTAHLGRLGTIAIGLKVYTASPCWL